MLSNEANLSKEATREESKKHYMKKDKRRGQRETIQSESVFSLGPSGKPSSMDAETVSEN